MAPQFEFKEKNMLTIEEQERAAYMAGDIDKAALLARIVDLEAINESLTEENEILRDQLADMERASE
jgi:hypothetical protein